MTRNDMMEVANQGAAFASRWGELVVESCFSSLDTDTNMMCQKSKAKQDSGRFCQNRDAAVYFFTSAELVESGFIH